MGIQRHLRPLRVHQATSRLLEVGVLEKEPPWYRIVSAIPPSTSLVRTAPVRLDDSPRKKKSSPSTMGRYFIPRAIIYPEDEARRRFFSDHPWELARPRIVLENDGKDYIHHDWSKMRQKAKQLDGESVVQREMWLRKHKQMSSRAAYNMARREFYYLRMREDIERRVAAEEATSVGAYFGKSYMEIGLEMEQNVLAKWKERATMEIIARKQRRAAAYSTGIDEDEDELEPPANLNVSIEEPEEPAIPSSL